MVKVQVLRGKTVVMNDKKYVEGEIVDLPPEIVAGLGPLHVKVVENDTEIKIPVAAPLTNADFADRTGSSEGKVRVMTIPVVPGQTTPVPVPTGATTVVSVEYPTVKRGRGRPPGAKNKPKSASSGTDAATHTSQP